MSAAALLSTSPTYALPTDHYATDSRLASGRWAKIKVSASGMQLITDAQLKNLGFSNPEAVHVFGLGGRELDFGLSSSTPDDIPLIPSVRTSKGLVFFAVDNVTWAGNNSDTNPYTHSLSQYSDDTYYFVSDIELDDITMLEAAVSASVPSNGAETFIERILHEQELEPAFEFGSQILGEDFRSKKFQTFSFTLPGLTEETAIANIRFGARTTSGTSTLSFTADGEALPAASRDKIAGCSSTQSFNTTETNKTIDGIKDGKFDLGIEYNYTGVLFKARLDYIEVFYRRALKFEGSELHFYVNYKREGYNGVTLSGCTSKTEIWDVTDPVRPERVAYTLDGDKASFSVGTGSDYREYIAFEPENVNRTVTSAGTVKNQNLHALEVPDMLIISPSEYTDGANIIADVHRNNDGMKVHVLTPEVIYNEFSGGKPDAGAFRRLMKMWYDRGEEENHKLAYCLIMGKALNDNKLVGTTAKSAGFKPMLMWQSYSGNGEESSYSNDSWLGMLEDVEAKNFTMAGSRINVAVGRMPVTTASEACDMGNKIKKYIEQPDFGAWRNKVMLIADDDDNNVHFRQTDNVYNNMRSQGNGMSHVYDRVILDSYELVMTSVGKTYPLATQRMLNNYNDGVLLTNYIGHANSTSWGHEHLWEWNQIKSMTNKRLTFIFGFTCGFVSWDTTELSGGEVLMLMPDSGVIGMIAATRSVLVDNNGNLSSRMMGHVFERAEDGSTLRWGDVFVKGMNDYLSLSLRDDNRLRYAIVGDPAIRIPGGYGEVLINEIDGQDITGEDTPLPEIAAMSSVTVSGTVTKADGTTDTDFNGKINLQLYDGERVITTLGNGTTGYPVSYNDRDKMLSTTTSTVTNGHWTATLRVPPEIQGNYTQAMIAAYAWSDQGRETSGTTDRLYVYGINEDVNDTEGPIFEAFYVNSPTLPEDAIISRNMIVFARLRDESGINLSQSGIGHSLLLTMDGKEHYSDLSGYFEQDSNDDQLGILSYPLEDVEPGRHTLTLTAWDNANNYSEASVDIYVGASVDPSIYDIRAIQRTASIDFRISLDRPNTAVNCRVGVYDLMGKKIWETDENVNTDTESNVTRTWNLCDSGGTRVPRGIYIYRVTVETGDGRVTSKSKKIAVGAEK